VHFVTDTCKSSFSECHSFGIRICRYSLAQ